jgi:hypothetical protein
MPILDDKTRKTLEEWIRLAMDEVIDRAKNNLIDQGHVLTGELLRSIEQRVFSTGDKVVSEMLLADHYEVVDTGVRSNKIPYSGRSGSGGTSKYIQALIRFWNLRGLSGVEAKRAAFATANRQKMEGMPTRGSFQHSRNGKRTGFLTDAIKDSEKVIRDLQGLLEELIQRDLDIYLRTIPGLKVSA